MVNEREVKDNRGKRMGRIRRGKRLEKNIYILRKM